MTRRPRSHRPNLVGPSVLQIRTLDLRPAVLGCTLLTVLEQRADELRVGALVIVDTHTMRLRMLPLGRNR